MSIFREEFKLALTNDVLGVSDYLCRRWYILPSFLYLLNMKAFNKCTLNKSQHSWSHAFQFYHPSSHPAFILSLSTHCGILHRKSRTQREKLSWGKIERLRGDPRLPGVKVYEFCSYTEREINEKIKKWGAGQKRSSTLFIKCHQCLRHKAEIPEASNS